jgi:hypothetical protein
LPEDTNVKLAMGIPQKSGPPNEWKPSGFTVAGYVEDAAAEDIQVVF